MKFYELERLPIKERFSVVNELKENNADLPPDVKLVNEIIEATINWFQNSSSHKNLNLIPDLKNANCELPSIFETIYEIKEKSIIEKLPRDERQRIFDDSKEAWCLYYPDFKNISEIMLKFKSDEMLIEFQKHSPPSFIREKAAIVYKKCLSYKVKLKQSRLDNLGYSYTPSPYCINYKIVYEFTNEYSDWGRKASKLWNEIYSLRDKYNSLYAYEDWKRYVKHSAVLKEKADEIQKLQNDALLLLNAGKEMVLKHDEAITVEYDTNGFEMSLYEREIEIALMYEGDDASDEEYCYAYTLECELFVFYVGIAANPRERFEQHIRGAFSDEAHLFKSKFIQKYHKEVKQNIVFEGIRRECKKFEKDYIAEFSPLGNMTDGGEG